jgi:hypothetical protein
MLTIRYKSRNTDRVIRNLSDIKEMTMKVLKAVSVGLIAVLFATPLAAVAQETGTDPRDFAPKFMPYYR